MSGFSVNSDALRTYAGVLGVGGHDINLAEAFGTKAAEYVAKYSGVPADEGDLFVEIYQANKNVETHLQAVMPKIGADMTQLATNLRNAATRYESEDFAAGVEFVQLWPGLTRPVAPAPGVATSGPLVDPAPILDAEPSDDAMIPDPVHWIMDKSGWFSISGVALNIAALFGFDPAGDLTKAVVGDYNELAQAGNALLALADFERTAADTLATGLETMLTQWTGDGASAADHLCTSYANALVDHAAQLETLGDKYNLLVQACAEIAQIIQSSLATVIDQLLICAANLAAAGCLASVPGINALIAIIGAYQVWVTREAIADFLRITGSVTTATTAFLSLTMFIASAFKDGTIESSFPKVPVIA